MKEPTGLRNKTSAAFSCAEDQILEHLVQKKHVLKDNKFMKFGNRAVNIHY